MLLMTNSTQHIPISGEEVVGILCWFIILEMSVERNLHLYHMDSLMVVSPCFMFVLRDSPIIYVACYMYIIVNYHLASSTQLLINIQWKNVVLHIYA